MNSTRLPRSSAISALPLALLTAACLVLLPGRPGLIAAEEKANAGPPPAPEEAKAYEELSKRGVSAVPLAAELNWRYVNFRDMKKPDAAVFALLKPCSLIVELNMSGVEIGDNDLANLAGLKNLVKLSLSNSTVTDAGLASLQGLDKLETLNLYHTGITDAGLAHLHGLKALKNLYVYETKVTEAGAKAMQEAVPGVKIDRGAPIPPSDAAPKPEEKKAAPAPAAPPAPPTPPTPKPPEAKPAEPKPTEAKPAEPKPAEAAKPAEKPTTPPAAPKPDAPKDAPPKPDAAK